MHRLDKLEELCPIAACATCRRRQIERVGLDADRALRRRFHRIQNDVQIRVHRLAVYAALLPVAMPLPVTVSAQERITIGAYEGALLGRTEAEPFPDAQAVDNKLCLHLCEVAEAHIFIVVRWIVGRWRALFLAREGAPVKLAQLFNVQPLRVHIHAHAALHVRLEWAAAEPSSQQMPYCGLGIARPRSFFAAPSALRPQHAGSI